MELNHLPVIDWELATRLANNQRNFAEEILFLLIKTLPSDIADLQRLHHQGNYLALRQALHKLHGALCYCGTPRLKMVIIHLETQLKNHIMDSSPSFLNELTAEANLLLEHYSYHLKPVG